MESKMQTRPRHHNMENMGSVALCPAFKLWWLQTFGERETHAGVLAAEMLASTGVGGGEEHKLFSKLTL